jgi:putative NADPH-quinone reductase
VRALVDRLFVPDWAFRYEPGRALPRGLLAGRSARVITTMDSPRWWYTLVLRRPIHRSFGSATLAFCGLRPLAFTTVHGVRELSETRRARWCEEVEALAHADARKAATKPRQLAAPQVIAP